jgi:hypothetical protein
MAKLETLYDLFPEQSQEAIRALVDDPEFQRQLPSLVLDRIKKSSGEVLPVEPEMVPLFFSRADFAEAEEIYKIANLFSHYFSHRGRFLPLAVDHLADLEDLRRKNRLTERTYTCKAEDFASRCLFSLSLFYGALERWHDKGAPHPGFYREMGKRTFANIGEESIADNFENWEEFVREKAFV